MSPKKIVITGASGLIGSALADTLRKRGDDVVALTRGSGPASWNPQTGDLDLGLIEGADAVVNLSGASIGPSSILQAPTDAMDFGTQAGDSRLTGAIDQRPCRCHCCDG